VRRKPRTLIVMVKEPRPGRVKTRLGAEIGMTRAAWWFRHRIRYLLRRLRDPRWHLVLAVSPDVDGLQSRVWPGDLPRIPQGTGHLGHRMLRAMAAAPPGPVCLIGADIPDVTSTEIAHAFRMMGTADAVLGPAEDGGYWLIGFRSSALAARALRTGALDRVRWSTPHAMADTVAVLPGLKIAEAARLADVDTKADLTRRARSA
tara:strand:- start:2463 stop:3074 length:612 start_codon:yes stop_codon:yes gene_type:complete